MAETETTTVAAPRPDDCPCIWWQPGGEGPWAVLCGPAWCVHHGDDPDAGFEPDLYGDDDDLD